MQLTVTQIEALNETSKIIYNYAREKGWWEESRSPLEIHMLCVSELAEATESVRNKEPALWLNEDRTIKTLDGRILAKPEGEASELADVVIRIMDYFGKQGWNLGEIINLKHNYNLQRPYRHGGKAL